MRGLVTTVFLLMLSALLAACQALEPERISGRYGSFGVVDYYGLLPHSMKGYELYSWFDEEEGSWRITLITGTNRLKTAEEITADKNEETGDGWVKITVTGINALHTLLERLPEGEQVIWQDGARLADEPDGVWDFSLPEEAVLEAAKQHSQALGVQLIVNR